MCQSIPLEKCFSLTSIHPWAHCRRLNIYKWCMNVSAHQLLGDSLSEKYECINCFSKRLEMTHVTKTSSSHRNASHEPRRKLFDGVHGATKSAGVKVGSGCILYDTGDHYSLPVSHWQLALVSMNCDHNHSLTITKFIWAQKPQSSTNHNQVVFVPKLNQTLTTLESDQKMVLCFWNCTFHGTEQHWQINWNCWMHTKDKDELEGSE